MAYDSNNIFAKILRGEIPSKKIYEDDFVLAFHDVVPQAPVHALVIPKGEYTDQADFALRASEAEIVGFERAVAKVAAELGLSAGGYRLIVNTGIDGGQEVPHFHVHILGGEKLGPMLSKT